jgi:hypothetical protein
MARCFCIRASRSLFFDMVCLRSRVWAPVRSSAPEGGRQPGVQPGVKPAVRTSESVAQTISIRHAAIGAAGGYPEADTGVVVETIIRAIPGRARQQAIRFLRFPSRVVSLSHCNSTPR